MEEKEKKKQIAKISIFITSVFVIFLSITYAFINMTLEGTKKQVITAGNISLELQEDTNNIAISDALPMYDEVGMIQEPFTFRLVNNTASDTNYSLKLVDITTGDKLSTSDVKYYLTKDGVGSPALLSNLTDGKIDSGTIAGSQTIEYTLRLWIDSSVTENSAIAGKNLSYRIDIEVSQEIEKIPVSEGLFASENLGENCKTYNDGTDTFLTGQCANNYVWYSGKLWRVVLKNNETGAVKMVTDNAITTIAYNASGNTAFENSYMDQWLNQEFLPTLHDTSEYLVENSIWDATLDASSTPARPTGTTTVQRTVGLLNAYEYYATYNNSDGLATYGTGYLNNKAGGSYGIYWWLLTPSSASDVWGVSSDGYLDVGNPAGGFGVRPSVNLKSTIQIESGTGTQSNPYILKGDTQETTNGTTLISTRYSGEYITFNNELYRIVGVETVNSEKLTKIIAVDKPSEFEESMFDENANTGYFSEASINTELEAYYQGLNSKEYNMIQPDTTWYLGNIDLGDNYKATICATVDESKSMQECEEKVTSTTANIGLPRVGEMFTSQITRVNRDTGFFWTLTPYDASSVWSVYYDGNLDYSDPADDLGARPSMYLKSTIKIASNNTGNGTYEKPYAIE